MVGTLETIRLFLAVRRMSFVTAADEQKVAEALRTRFPAASSGNGESREEAASLYLHKIVQTTVPLSALSRFDTEAYLVLLQLSHKLDKDGLRPYIDRCTDLRQHPGLLDDLRKWVARVRDERRGRWWAEQAGPVFKFLAAYGFALVDVQASDWWEIRAIYRAEQAALVVVYSLEFRRVECG